MREPTGSRVKPIKPSDVGKTLSEIIPDGVIEAWNNVIAKHFKEYAFSIDRDCFIDEISSIMQCTRTEVFSEKWLDIEELYRDAGWEVNYSQQYYTFRRKSV
jgi:hypothetical protein